MMVSRRLLVLPALLALLCAAAAGLASELSHRPLENFAASLERGRVVVTQDEAFRQRVARLIDDSAGTCGRNAARARVTSALFLMREGDGDDLSRLTSTIRDGLSCNPLDGNLWLLAAQAEAQTRNAEGVQRAWNRSIETRPLEGAVLDRRWALGPALLANGLVAQEDLALQLDLSNQAKLAEPAAAAATLVKLRARGFADLAGSVVAGLPDGRKKRLRDHTNKIMVPRREFVPSPFRSDQQG